MPQNWQDRGKIAYDVDVIMCGKKRNLLSNCCPIRSECCEKPRAPLVKAVISVPMTIEETKLFVSIVVEAPTGGANGKDWHDSKYFRCKFLKGFGTLLANLVY